MNGAIIGIAFILVGILLSGVGIYFFIKTKRIMAHEMGVLGKVTNQYVKEHRDYETNDISCIYYLEIEFQADGSRYFFKESVTSSDYKQYPPNASIEIMYDARNPKRAMIKKNKESIQEGNQVVFWLSIGAFVIGAVLLFFNI